jgi:peptidoglycan biosynthesis protein MviN/MurJ (putative lipid II flippase)
LNLILVQVYEERGLALGTAICATLQVIWLGRRLSKRLPELRRRSVLGPVMRMLVPTLVMMGALIGLGRLADGTGWLGDRDWLRLTIMVGLGMGSYTAVARMMRIEELGDVLHRRIKGS